MTTRTTDELDDFFIALQALLGGITGVQQAVENPPEGLGDPPMAMAYVVYWTPASNSLVVYRVHAEIILARSSLPDDMVAARPFVLKGLAAFADDVYVGGTCQYCMVVRGVGPGPIKWQGQEYFGVRFELDVKIDHKDTFTFF